jgi:PEP-CTERM motif
MTIHRMVLSIAAALLGLSIATSAMAIPNLQLYIEGATYETSGSDPETWAKLGTDSFRLWVIADTSASYRLRDVKLVASFADGLTPSLTFQASTTGGAGGFTDNSTPGSVSGPSGSPFEEGGHDAENWSHGGGDSDINPRGPLETHGMLTHGRSGVEWNLGLFNLVDSPIADFQLPGGGIYNTSSGLPPPTIHSGQINVYDVNVSGLQPGEQVHFDVYGIEQERNRCTGSVSQNLADGCILNTTDNKYYKWVDKINSGGKPGSLALLSLPMLSYANAPYSHDAGLELIEEVPAPGTTALMLGGLGLLGWFVCRRQAA